MNNRIPYAYIENGKFIYSLSEMERLFEFKQEMENCDQGAKWHKEGNVWIHTTMVMDNLLNSSEFKDMSPEDQFIIFYATLLHDVGKPSTSEVEADGNITAKKHSMVGAQMARWFFIENPIIDFKTREQIANLVYLHMTPPRLIERKDPQRAIIKSSFSVRNNLLHLLSVCDTKGRISENDAEDKRTSLEKLALYKEYAIENNCYMNEFKFTNNLARFAYFVNNKDYVILDQRAWYDQPTPKGTAVLMSGVPGVGKDWVARHSYGNYTMIGLDNTRQLLGVKHGEAEGEVSQKTIEMAKELLRVGTSFVMNCTNTHKLSREKWIKLFDDYDFATKIHYVERPLNKILSQNKNREAVVPEEYILKKLRRIDMPLETECHEIQYDV